MSCVAHKQMSKIPLEFYYMDVQTNSLDFKLFDIEKFSYEQLQTKFDFDHVQFQFWASSVIAEKLFLFSTVGNHGKLLEKFLCFEDSSIFFVSKILLNIVDGLDIYAEKRLKN